MYYNKKTILQKKKRNEWCQIVYEIFELLLGLGKTMCQILHVLIPIINRINNFQYEILATMLGVPTIVVIIIFKVSSFLKIK